MNVRPSILCPIDYSSASAGALRYAAAVAAHFETRLIVLTVADPRRRLALDLGTGMHRTRETSERELGTFVANTFADDAAGVAMCEYDVAIGRPPAEILRVARERSCDLIVMSSHGLTGARQPLFGSTTERVLHETTVPVLVTPPVNPGAVHVEDAAQLIGRIIVPVDLSPASIHQMRIAGGLAEALNLPLVLVHVIDPAERRLLSSVRVAGLDSNRLALAERALDELAGMVPRGPRPEALIVFGDPAEEAARIVRDRRVGLVVMGLRGSPSMRPRMGSVTYRLLCLAPTLVLALPPRVAGLARGPGAVSTSAAIARRDRERPRGACPQRARRRRQAVSLESKGPLP